MDEFFFSYPLEDNIASASEILRNLTLYRTQKSTVIVSVLSEITKYDQSFSIYQLGKDSSTFSLSWDWFRDIGWYWSRINISLKSLKKTQVHQRVVLLKLHPLKVERDQITVSIFLLVDYFKKLAHFIFEIKFQRWVFKSQRDPLPLWPIKYGLIIIFLIWFVLW